MMIFQPITMVLGSSTLTVVSIIINVYKQIDFVLLEAGCTEINIKGIGVSHYGKYKCYVKVKNQDLVTTIEAYEIKPIEGWNSICIITN